MTTQKQRGPTAQDSSLVPTLEEWTQYKRSRKNLSRACERYRRENRELRERIRHLEGFLLELATGGIHEKDYVHASVSAHPEYFGFCERGGSTDACGCDVSRNRSTPTRDEILQKLADIIEAEQLDKAMRAFRRGVCPGDDLGNVRGGFGRVGCFDNSDLPFPVLRGRPPVAHDEHEGD